MFRSFLCLIFKRVQVISLPFLVRGINTPVCNVTLVRIGQTLSILEKEMTPAPSVIKYTDYMTEN